MSTLKSDSITLKEGEEHIKLDYSQLRQAVKVLRAVNHNLRQQMIALIDENDSMTVTDIYVKMRLEQSVASQHLAILRKAGMVKTTREGKFIYYSLDKDRIGQIASLVEDIIR